MLQNIYKATKKIAVKNKKTVNVERYEIVKIKSFVNNANRFKVLKLVTQAPGVMYSLVSCIKAQKSGNETVIDNCYKNANKKFLRLLQKR